MVIVRRTLLAKVRHVPPHDKRVLAIEYFYSLSPIFALKSVLSHAILCFADTRKVLDTIWPLPEHGDQPVYTRYSDVQSVTSHSATSQVAPVDDALAGDDGVAGTKSKPTAKS